MKAMVINGYGGPEAIVAAEMPVPRPGAGEVLVRIRAAAVNPADGKWRDGMFASFAPVAFPHVLGYDVAGEVEAGEGFAPGTRVAGMLDPFVKGGYAEYVAGPAANFCAIPDGLAFETAAAIPTAGLTGTQLAEQSLDVQPGQTVLVTGAIGAVGRFAVRAVLGRGGRVVAAVRAAQAAEARALGVADVIALEQPEWAGPPFDGVLDTVGGEAVGQLCRHLAPGGRIITAATTPIPAEGLAAQPEFIAVQPSGSQLAALCEAVAAGEIAVPVAVVLPLSEAAEAQQLTARGGLGGKVVLKP